MWHHGNRQHVEDLPRLQVRRSKAGVFQKQRLGTSISLQRVGGLCLRGRVVGRNVVDYLDRNVQEFVGRMSHSFGRCIVGD